MDETTSISPLSTARSIPGSVVDVEEAVGEFRRLDHEITSEARKEDVENGASGWNIREFFEEGVRNGEQTGHKLKRMGVVVKNLTVLGMGADASSIPTNIDILKAFWPPTWYFFSLIIYIIVIIICFLQYTRFKKNKGTPFNILSDVSAFCKDGEMLLVLGRPGAGCSSFLRVVSNERSIFLDVKGDVKYAFI